MSDGEVIETLAGRDGWERKWSSGIRVLAWWKAGLTSDKFPLYLTSRDALAPVLQTMSLQEQMNLDVIILDKRRRSDSLLKSAAWLLTLPPRDLAHAIAEAIQPNPKQTP